jgi:pilus assembly protein FimV
MEEVDPISEADVYLAYGRYKQAEELIRSAIAQNPERDECKLKLLEIHYATENAEAFEEFAQSLAKTHQESKPDFWEKVVEMGQELCPGNPLFGGGGNAPATASNVQRAAGTLEAARSHISAGDLLELETEEVKRNDHTAIAPQHEPAEASAEGIDYDFFATETQDSSFNEEAEAEDEADLHYLDNIISFDKSPVPTVASGATASPDKTLDDILAELGVVKDSQGLTPASPEIEAEDIDDGNSIDFDAEFKRMFEAEALAQFEEEPAGQMALTEMDEIETKLDLAKAYFDMGDDDAARVILENVAALGTNAQKEEAWSLLSRLTRKEANRR